MYNMDFYEQFQMHAMDLNGGRLPDPEVGLGASSSLHYRLPKGVKTIRCEPNEHGEYVPVES